MLGAKGEQNVFDPSQLGDDVAMRTTWTPEKGGGANFRTHKLVEVRPYRLEFRATTGARLFYMVFILMGIGVFIGFSFKKATSIEFSFDMSMMISLALCLIFTGAGGFMLYFGTSPIVFDKTKGAFWKGRKSPDEVFDRRDIKDFAQFDRIHALQLISEYVRGSKSSYHSYEMNLVLENGHRINIVDHGDKDRLREDAKTLSAFLERPVWDAI